MNNFAPFDQQILAILKEKRNELRKYYENTSQLIFSAKFSNDLEEVFRVSSMELDVYDYTVLDDFHRSLEDSLGIEKSAFQNVCSLWIEKQCQILLNEQIEQYQVKMDAIFSSYIRWHDQEE